METIGGYYLRQKQILGFGLVTLDPGALSSESVAGVAWQRLQLWLILL